MKKALLEKIKRVEKIASASKISRMLVHPYKYLNAILYRKLVYKKTKKEKEVLSLTFFNSKMNLLLPSSTDIYLTGGKSHDSEIRLAKFLINQLKGNDTFLDVGAHCGYFSLLSSKLVGNSGKVYAFEASPTTFSILQKNQKSSHNIQSYNVAISDSKSPLTFYEFPNLYSEYNTLDIEQFKEEDWYHTNKPKEIVIEGCMLDEFLIKEKINPTLIKIDVEGAEYKVINGLKKHLSSHSPILILEYLSEARGNAEHVKAKLLLESFHYQSYLINQTGELIKSNSISDHLNNMGLDSDNVVFQKKD